MKKLVTILVVNFNTADFIEISLYALKKLTKNAYSVFILDNGSEVSDYKKLQELCSAYENCFLERKETNLRSSLAHGEGLDYLAKKVQTPYFSVLDADAIWLIKDWDEILIKEINDEVKVIGTESSGNKPKDFPLMYAALLETRTFKELKVSFKPKDISKLQDTGFEIREKYLRHGYKGKVLREKNTRYYKEGPFREIICTEYYLNGIKHIFASHFGRGSTLGINKYSRGKGVSSIYKIPFLSYPLRRWRGKKEKNKWISICGDVIDNQ